MPAINSQNRPHVRMVSDPSGTHDYILNIHFVIESGWKLASQTPIVVTNGKNRELNFDLIQGTGPNEVTFSYPFDWPTNMDSFSVDLRKRVPNPPPMPGDTISSVGTAKFRSDLEDTTPTPSVNHMPFSYLTKVGGVVYLGYRIDLSSGKSIKSVEDTDFVFDGGTGELTVTLYVQDGPGSPGQDLITHSTLQALIDGHTVITVVKDKGKTPAKGKAKLHYKDKDDKGNPGSETDNETMSQFTKG